MLKDRINIGSRVAKKLKWLRSYYGLSKQSMANRLHMNVSTYTKNEANVATTSIFTLWDIHDKLGVSLDWLLLDKGPVSEADRLELIGDIYEREQPSGNDKKGAAEEMETKVHQKQINEMVALMKKVPAVHFAMMNAFHEYKLKNADLIEKEKAKNLDK